MRTFCVVLPSLLLLSACRAKPWEADTGSGGTVDTDCPELYTAAGTGSPSTSAGSATLRLNLKVDRFEGGLAQGAHAVTLTVDRVEVTVERLVGGQFQPPEQVTVATGPAPITIWAPESELPVFAGDWRIPAGRVRDVRVHVHDTAVIGPVGEVQPVVFGLQRNPVGVLRFQPPQGTPAPVLQADGLLGWELVVPAGALGALHPEQDGSIRMDPVLPGGPVPKPRAFVACRGPERAAPEDTAPQEDTDVSCEDAAGVCLLSTMDPEGFDVTLPTDRTSEWVGWRPFCYGSAAEAQEEQGHADDWEINETPGLWFDFSAGERTYFRYLDCAFVTWTSHPYAIANDEGEEVDGLPVGWRFAEGTEAWKVEELVLGVEVSWAWRYGTDCCADGYDDHIYDWATWQDEGLTRWRFCHVFESDSLTTPECHEFAYDPTRQVLGGLVTTGTEPLGCFDRN